MPNREASADAVPAFDAVRPRLFGIAYRMLGSVDDAQDIVQDTWLRWQQTDRSAVRDVTAFLVTTTTRLALNTATSARARRESYVGPWLPEPIHTSADPATRAEQGEALGLALLLLLQRLNPIERAVYVLREAFDYPFRQIAEVLDITEANARQLGRRARTHLAEERHAPVAPADHGRLLHAFLAAARSGDLGQLEKLLARDVVSYADGGGIVSAARVPVTGRTNVARYIVGLAAKFGMDVSLDVVESNGHEAVLVRRAESVVALCAIDASPEGIIRVLIVLNPTKLARFGLSDLQQDKRPLGSSGGPVGEVPR
ncbi:RNA polymerase sigma-70 factor [Micromonospora phytophila]|uniref:RNA polymerase sigma-70 factor n=1 Tax=Micromonospora phytophila TaxID=709888 RepID=UPI00202DBBAA|nr:RNA polymerase sigma-70 factor [Micromonospora phytophila]MCM0674413.1 RNA polymerase sigma-70 factor [Micromonospora phytophila]